ncbi:MAG: glycosyl hydrolase, BNR repeat-containing protein, partial [Bacteroidetes bacterium]|nr:glycosyl hydrolase, BNR repeat-containing protein [Bacteroidota bacterium]
TMPGEGIYKSMDAGKTWKHTGLAEAQTISEIVIHPKNADLVYAAVFGHVFGSNPERGVYRSKDGGKTWEKILYKNEKTGAVDLVFDPLNPRVLYAALWEAYRNPWSMSSGGPGSGLWKSTDGGDTWTDISMAKGMPKGIKGRIGVAASAANADLVWAMVEAEPDGGLYRSDDAGKTWRRTNEDRRLRQRAWYYTHVYADPKNSETVYILNTGFYKSLDGGRTLSSVQVPHGDNHDLWIAPNDPLRMINANDGGGNVTYNGGRTWTEQDFATAQFYHVSVDNQFPYRVYGAQQDNSTISIASRTNETGIDKPDWFDAGGGESGYVSARPDNPDIVFAGNYGGLLTRYDRKTNQSQNVNVWPDNPMGGGAESMKYRFQWTFPIVFSPHDANVLYVTGNHVFKSTNEGMIWDMISPDLTRNDTGKLGSSGGPITKDNTSVEYYGTIFTFAESPVQKGVLWAGSDDGVIQVSLDAGANWRNVTPKDLPEWSRISLIDVSHHDAATAYAAIKRYQLDDFKPYVYKTNDFGKTWKKIVRGIPDNEFVHAVREDPNKKGLLYAGTERGVWVSFDDGENWQTLQLNLPVDQLSDEVSRSDAYLYQPRPTYRFGGASVSRPGIPLGKNPPGGVVVLYYVKAKPAGPGKLEFLDDKGSVMKSFVLKPDAAEGDAPQESVGGGFGGGQVRDTVTVEPGTNRFIWDMRYSDATNVPGGLLWAGTTRGPRAAPGKYQVRLTVEGKTFTQIFEIRKNPGVVASQEDFQAQVELALKIRDKVTAAHKAVNTIRDIKGQIDNLTRRMRGQANEKNVADASKSLKDKLTAVEEEIIQVKIKSSQDALNYPIKLNNKLAALLSSVSGGDARPTKQSYGVFEDLSAKVDIELAKLKQVMDADLPAFNRTVKDADVPAVILRQERN